MRSTGSNGIARSVVRQPGQRMFDRKAENNSTDLPIQCYLSYLSEFPKYRIINSLEISLSIPVVPHKAVAEVSRIGNV